MKNIYNNMIRSLFIKVDMSKYSHLIIAVDKSEMKFIKIFVKRSDDIKDVLFNIVSNPTYEINEIYNYDMDLEEQIAEARTYHINAIYNQMNKDYYLQLKSIKDKHGWKSLY